MLGPGTRLGAYEVVSVLGAGGMGEVYRARDTRLHRDVAIKVLPEAFARDADRLARFEREAQVLASLSHPNIAAIHGLEESGAVRALVLELVDGPTLADRIARGPVALDEALDIARQIAEALQAAHEHGVIHRDLKPSNIKLTADGVVKVLDFGLAKAVDAAPVAAGQTMSPTITSPALMTGIGVILGTAAYMAPEQAKGRPADKRSDIWAFGCVLYEMLAGKRPFEGEDVADTLAFVLSREPDWAALPASTPSVIRALLPRCLEKDRRKRVADIAVALYELDVRREHRVGIVGSPVLRRRERFAWVSALVIVMVAGTAIVVRERRSTIPVPETRLDITTPPTDDPYSFAISPDGLRIVFVASDDGRSRLWLRNMSAATAQPLPGTEGATYPFWSPDSRSIGFFSNRSVRRFDLVGGRSEKICDTPGQTPHGGTWSADGTVLYSSSTIGGRIFRVAATGGQPQAITTLSSGQMGHVFPQFLPNTRRFLFYVVGSDEVSGVYLSSLDTEPPTRIAPGETPAVYVPPAWLLFGSEGALFARRFDAERGLLTGDRIKVADEVGFDPVIKSLAVSASADGVITYRATGTPTRQLTWVNRSGQVIGVVGPRDQNGLRTPRVSPDGRRVAATRVIQNNNDVWIFDDSRVVRLTFGANDDSWPIWSPDGTRIVFSRVTKMTTDLYVMASNGSGAQERLVESESPKSAYSWSSDGRVVLFGTPGDKTGLDIWPLTMTGDRKPSAWLAGPFNERQAQFSPDLRWVTYQSDESGRNEIYVRPFPGPGGQWQVSTAGGISPRWRADGKELYYLAPDAKLMAAPITIAGDTFKPGMPFTLFQTRIADGGTGLPGVGQNWQYDVAPDGRFLINVNLEETSTTPITITQNWMPEP